MKKKKREKKEAAAETRDRSARWAMEDSPKKPAVHPPDMVRSAQAPPSMKEDIFGVDSRGLVRPGATVTLSATSVKRGTPQKMCLTHAVARTFIINDIRVGVEPVMLTMHPVSAAIFLSRQDPYIFRPFVCEPGMDVSVTVTNIGLKDARFTATVSVVPLPWPPGSEVRECPVTGQYCEEHGFTHGEEAEELRKAIEEADDLDELKAQLDNIDARDSLAFLDGRAKLGRSG